MPNSKPRLMRLLVAGSLSLTCAHGLIACDRGPSARQVESHAAKNFAAQATLPDARRGDQIDDFHGEKVADPYRWLEDYDSLETRRWVEAQNSLTFEFLEAVAARPMIKERLTQLWEFDRFGIPVKRGDRYFYTHNDGVQNQAVLYVAEPLDAEPRALLDPNKLAADGTVALSIWSPSEDGRLLAYGTAEAGSDWLELRIRDVATGRDLPDRISWVMHSSISWAKDGSGFYYSRYDEPASGEVLAGINHFHQLFFHKVGDPQSKDQLIYERPDQPEWFFIGDVTDDGRYLIIYALWGANRANQILYRDLRDPTAPVIELITGFDAQFTFVGNEKGHFWFRTDFGAPRGRLIAVDIAQPERTNWRTVIAEAPEVLEGVTSIGDRFFANYLEDGSSRVKVIDSSGSLMREVQLPSVGNVGGFTLAWPLSTMMRHGRRSDREIFYSFESFFRPASIYRYDVRSNESTVFRQPNLKFNADDFETRQVFVSSKDGTRVPMFLTYRRGLRQDGDNPTILTGYGGFGISRPPRFSVTHLTFMEMGGVLAQANLRGGLEYGRAWHEAGRRERKQNVFDDFVASAEWLIANRYTRPARLAIQGASNGGLLVGAAMTQRPELFGAVLPGVGVLDMLRFHRFTIGWAWATEYGSPDSAEDFQFLFAYSPLHNVQPGTRYPPTLITTGDHDNRVPPAHSYKFAATLQHAQAGDAPVLIRIDTRTGHGQGRPTTKEIELAADSLAFIHEVLGMD